MNLALLVYSISVLSNLDKAFGMLFIALVISAFVSALLWLCNADYEKELSAKGKQYTKLFVSGALASLLVTVFIPSEKTAYAMVGAYAAQKVYENPQVQQLEDKVLKVINVKLDALIEEPAKKP